FSAEMDGLTELTRAREGELRERLVQFQRVERILMLILGTLAAVVVAYLGWLMLALVRARTAALEERDQLEAVLGSVDSGIVLLDRDLRVLAANGRASELLGVPQEVLVGGDQRRIASERLKPRMADPASFEKRLLHLYDNPDAVAEDRVEVALPETRLLSRYSSPVRDESGAIFGRIEVYRDVTESLRRERELEEANERKDRFVATLSHELRTPLTPILGWLELLRREQDPQTRARGLDAIERNVVLEAQLVEDLLDLSRVVNQKLELAFTRMHVGEAIAAAVDTVRHLADAKGVRLEVASPGVPLAIEADETRFIQVIWNLVSNAIKFTPPGGLVRVAARAHGERLVVSVDDEGEGIRPELLEHIFKPFEQDLRQGQGRGGLGIGLALCRSLVELHGGSIAAESEGPGQGARFSFWLPLAGSPGVAAAPAGRGLRVRAEALLPHRRDSGAEAGPARAGAGSGSNGGAVRSPPWTPRSSPGGGALAGEDGAGTRRRLLLVEDNPDTLEAMRILLSAWGYGVTAASNVAQAREALSRGGQEVVISDIGMPHVDGMAFAREVRSREATEDGGRRLALVAISGYASQADRRGALEAGFDAYVTKPIDFVSLKAILDRLAPAPTRSTRA
ncbi:MAG: ATP-binding protein, partial [Gemmatimonadota bacterium]